jgi:hypothetical protein
MTEQDTFNLSEEENKVKIIRPIYTVTETNLIELLDYYFPNVKHGDIQSRISIINIAKITLDDLEYVAEMILPHLQLIWSAFEDEYPTQSNIIDFALETFYDFNWDNSEKEYARKRVIESIKKEAESQKTLRNKNTHQSKEFIEKTFLKNLHMGRIPPDYEKPSHYWSDSQYYNDDLDWNEQSEEFYNDVL